MVSELVVGGLFGWMLVVGVVFVSKAMIRVRRKLNQRMV